MRLSTNDLHFFALFTRTVLARALTHETRADNPSTRAFQVLVPDNTSSIFHGKSATVIALNGIWGTGADRQLAIDMGNKAGDPGAIDQAGNQHSIDQSFFVAADGRLGYSISNIETGSATNPIGPMADQNVYLAFQPDPIHARAKYAMMLLESEGTGESQPHVQFETEGPASYLEVRGNSNLVWFACHACENCVDLGETIRSTLFSAPYRDDSRFYAFISHGCKHAVARRPNCVVLKLQ